MNWKKLFRRYGAQLSIGFVLSFILFTTFAEFNLMTVPYSLGVAFFMTVMFEFYKTTRG